MKYIKEYLKIDLIIAVGLVISLWGCIYFDQQQEIIIAIVSGLIGYMSNNNGKNDLKM